MNNLQPKKEHKFSFGLWTVGNPGRDPFGEPTRQPISPVTIVKRLSELGAYGVNFHDNDLVPIDAGAAEVGAKIYVFWGGREGVESDAGRDACEAIKWFREAMNFLCEYSISQGYGYKFALEAKPNEPRGDIYFPSTGAYLGFINTLDHPEMVGVNPEVGHEQMSGLNFYHVVAQALEAGKLFHIDLNDQKGP